MMTEPSDAAAARWRAGPAGFGPTLETVHLECSSAQLGTLELVMEMEISAAQFNSSQPKVPLDKQQ